MARLGDGLIKGSGLIASPPPLVAGALSMVWQSIYEAPAGPTVACVTGPSRFR
jgi:hypothetical protein